MVALPVKPLVIGVVGSVVAVRSVAVGSVVVKPLVIGAVGSVVAVRSVAVGSVDSVVAVDGAPSLLYQCRLWATSVHFSSYW